MKLNKSILLKSFLISFLYVGLGSLSILGSYPGFFFSGDWTALGLLITMPVSVLGFGISYMESDNYELILLIQSSVFFVFWLIVYLIWMKNTRKKNIEKIV